LAAKAARATATQLAHPCPSSQLYLAVDASEDHVGAVLQKHASLSSPWRPLGFFSQKFDPAQVKYSAFDRELFACIAAIRHFLYMLEGRTICIFTDHKPLIYTISKVLDPWTAHQSRHMYYVAKFTSDLCHIPWIENVLADTLSRPPVALACTMPAGHAQLYLPAIASAQRTCPSVEAAKTSSLQLQLVRFGDVRVLCDITLASPCPFILSSTNGQSSTPSTSLLILVFAQLGGSSPPG
jgi:hypothetical protein